jgi:hypothetical protein
MEPSIQELALEVRRDWARPSAGSARALENLLFSPHPSPEDIVAFLANAGAWRGPAAVRIKGELLRRARTNKPA